MTEYVVPPGMPLSVFHNKYSRKNPDGSMQSYKQRITEVIDGNFLLDSDFDATEYYHTLKLAIAGIMPTSGRHLQHGDINQPNKKMELFTNCATAMFSFMLMRCLLQGSGVGRDYSSECCRVDWSNMPDVRLVLDEAHPDFRYDLFQGAMEPLRDARHKYDSESEKVRWFEVGDSREGWAKIIEILETAAWQEKHKDKLFIFDFSKVRAAGQPIMGMQGRPASGPISLMNAIAKVASTKSSGMKPWKQALFIDHYVAAAVQFGGVRRCLPAGTLVTTSRGAVPIEDVVIDDTIVTPRGRAPVTAVFDQGMQSTINIRHQFGRFECTAEHRMAVFDSLSTWTFKRAGELVPGDRLVFDSAGWDFPGETVLPLYESGEPRRAVTGAGGDTNSVMITIPELTPDVAWLLGFIQGNGYVGDKALGLSSNAFLPYGVKILAKAAEILTVFGLPLGETKAVTGENTLVLRTHSVHLVRYLAWLKAPKTTLTVPDCVRFGTREVRAGYLAGLFDADGSNNRPLQLLVSIYETFVEQVQQLYLSLGVLTQKTGGVRRESETWHPLYQVSTKGFENVEAINLLFEHQSVKLDYRIAPSQGGFTFPTSMVRRELKAHWITANANQTTARIRHNLNREFVALPLEVLALEPGRNVTTYDIEVDGLAQFTANGLVTHNSARMSVKNWRDRDVIEFIDIKRGGFLWSSNNSLLVDQEFWAKAAQPQPSHARRVFEAAVAASYWDATGEPGFINVDLMNTNKDGIEGITAENYISEITYPDLHPRTRDMIENVLGHVKKLEYPFLTNPCFSAGTLIVTDQGAEPIEDLIGRTVRVWDGTEWVEINNFRVTGKNQSMLRITLQDGSYVRVTPAHTMILESGDRVPAAELDVGQKLRLSNVTYDGNFQEKGVYLNDVKSHAGLVVSVEEDGIDEKVYCCTVPNTHQISLGIGIVTGQCGEIALSTWGGYCVIGDINLSQVKNVEDAEAAAYFMAKFLVRVNLMKSDYKAEVLRTNRIGVGLTGIHEFAWNMFGLTFHDMIEYYEAVFALPFDLEPLDYKAHHFWMFIDELRLVAMKGATELSEKLGLVIPHTVTTIKPSGTISKVMNCTEGVHLPALKYYLRWVQYKYNDADLQVLRERGYPIKDVSHRYPEYVVVGFPTKQPIVDLMGGDKVVTADETTPEQNYRWLMLLEHFWLGGRKENNQVSYTLKYDPSTVSYLQFMEMTLRYQPLIRCCSVMPQSDWKKSEEIYSYVPEQPISEYEYAELMNRINPVAHEGYDTEQLTCESGVCPIEEDVRHTGVTS